MAVQIQLDSYVVIGVAGQVTVRVATLAELVQEADSVNATDQKLNIMVRNMEMEYVLYIEWS